MRQTAIGNTNISVGAIAYGCWRFAESSVEDADTKIRAALDAMGFAQGLAYVCAA